MSAAVEIQRQKGDGVGRGGGGGVGAWGCLERVRPHAPVPFVAKFRPKRLELHGTVRQLEHAAKHRKNSKPEIASTAPLEF
jgi:hypothetical protein